MRVAAFDLGSNSLKLSIMEKAPDGRISRLHDEERVTRISEAVEKTGVLKPAAMERTLNTLRERVAFARDFDLDRLACVATAGLRGAGGRDLFVERARAEASVDVQIIDGHREAELAFRSSRLALGGDSRARFVVDVGGRSTEIAFGEGEVPSASVSLALGGVRLTESYLKTDPPLSLELEACEAAIDATIRAQIPADFPRPVTAEHPMVGVSGTILALAGLELEVFEIGTLLRRVEGARLLRSAIEAQFDALRALTSEERVRGSVVPEGRADVIVAGVAIIRKVMDFFGAPELLVGAGGVGPGLALAMLDGIDPRSLLDRPA